nr:hypothetical protein [Tanacetum cinerariifolium]
DLGKSLDGFINFLVGSSIIFDSIINVFEKLRNDIQALVEITDRGADFVQRAHERSYKLTSSEVEPDTEPLQLQTFADIQAFLLFKDELEKESNEEEVLAAGDDIDQDSQDDAEVRTPSQNQTQPEPSHVQESASFF